MASFEILKPVLSSESLLEFVVLQAGFFPLLHLSDEEMLPFDLRTVGWKLIQKMTFAFRQGGRTWQTFVGSKNGNENFCQARIYNFCVKCVIFARNRKFAKLTQ